MHCSSAWNRIPKVLPSLSKVLSPTSPLELAGIISATGQLRKVVRQFQSEADNEMGLISFCGLRVDM